MKQKNDRTYLHNEIDILNYIYMIKKDKILFFGTCIFFILSSVILQFALPKYYETQAIIRGGTFYNLTKNIADLQLILQSKETLTYAIKDYGLNIKLPELRLFFQNGMLRPRPQEILTLLGSNPETLIQRWRRKFVMRLPKVLLFWKTGIT